jgi:hypothetical protein
MTNEENEIADIIADAAPLPLLDAAYALWRRRCRLDTLEGRPTAEEVRINRTLTPEQFSAKYRWDRHHARDGPAFSHLKRAHPRADDGAIKQAIMTAVKFEDACFKNFEQAPANTGNAVNTPWHAHAGIFPAFTKTLPAGRQRRRLLLQIARDAKLRSRASTPRRRACP